jgi:ATP-dependent Clp protease ATP-binding subunit ClpC
MIVFHALTQDNIFEIAKNMLDGFQKRVKQQMDITVRYGKSVIQYVSDKGFDKDYGARPLRRAIQNQIEDTLAAEVVEGNVNIGDTVRISVKNDKVCVQKLTKK